MKAFWLIVSFVLILYVISKDGDGDSSNKNVFFESLNIELDPSRDAYGEDLHGRILDDGNGSKIDVLRFGQSVAQVYSPNNDDSEEDLRTLRNKLIRNIMSKQASHQKNTDLIYLLINDEWYNEMDEKVAKLKMKSLILYFSDYTITRDCTNLSFKDCLTNIQIKKLEPANYKTFKATLTFYTEDQELLMEIYKHTQPNHYWIIVPLFVLFVLYLAFVLILKYLVKLKAMPLDKVFQSFVAFKTYIILNKYDIGEYRQLLDKDILYNPIETNKKIKIIEEIIDKTNIQNYDIVLQKASEVGNIELVQFSLDKGANIEAKNNFNKTPLMLAIEKGNQNIVDFLIQKGATKVTPIVVTSNSPEIEEQFSEPTVFYVDCINCNTEYENPSSSLCANCGKSLYEKDNSIKCKSCGGEYDPEETNCPICGI